MTVPMPENTAAEASENYQEAHPEKERRDGPKDRRKTSRDRRDPERVAEEIAPRRHPDVKGRRTYDD